jgi:hypothetical protein
MISSSSRSQLPAELCDSFKTFPERSKCSNITTLRLEPAHTSSRVASCVQVVSSRSVQLHGEHDVLNVSERRKRSPSMIA